MEIFCPTCMHPIKIDLPQMSGDKSDDLRTKAIVTRVHCPNCGLVELPRARDETISWDDRSAQLTGTSVAHFTLIRMLGQGASGRVWLADDNMLQRQVALKLPHLKFGDTTYLLREAQTAAHLRHPNIVSVYEVGSDGDQVFIACEYVEGLTLRDYLSQGTPEISESVALITAVASALHHAHEQGIVHRDVKPSNILLNRERQPFVADFGLAKRISRDETISSEGQILGTARYMSPEQAAGRTRETDQRSDVYAIGVILFEMLTGHLPYRGSVRAVLDQKVYEDAPSPRKLAPTLPRDLETICLKCLERDPARRYQSAAEVTDELKRFEAGKPIKARPITALERGWRWCRRRPAVAGLLASLILSLSTGLAGVSYFYWQAERSAESTRQALYRSEMNLASEYYERGDISGVRQMLDRVVSEGRAANLRGFEWRYFDRLIEPYVQNVNQGDVSHDVAISHNGDFLASIGANDKSIFVWNAMTGESVRTLPLESGRYRAIDFSPVGNLLLAGSTDGMLRIWDVAEDDQPRLEVRHGPPSAPAKMSPALVRFSPKGDQFVSATTSGQVRIREVDTGTLAAEIPAGPSGAKDVRYSAGGELLAIGSQDGRVRVWDLETKTTTAVLEPNPYLECMAISDDGLTVVTGSYGGTVRTWSVEDGGLRQNLNIESGRIGDLEFVKGTALVVVVASTGQLRVLDTSTLREIRKLKTHNLTDGVLARSENGEFLAVGSGDGSVKTLQVDRVIKPNVFWHDKHIRGVRFLSDSVRLVAADGGGGVRIWDTETGESTDLSQGPNGEVSAVSVDLQGDLIAVATIEERVLLWDGETGEQVGEIHVPEPEIVGASFSPAGQQLAVVTRHGGSFLYESEDWRQPQWSTSASEASAEAFGISPDGRMMAIGYENGEIRFVSMADGAPQADLIVVPTIPRALAFCESGNLLAIGTDSGEIHLHDLVAGKARSIIKAHTSRLNALAVLPGGKTLGSGGRDKVLRLSDTASGEPLAAMFGHERQVFSLSVSPDGSKIASGGLEGDIRIWRSR